MKKVRAKKHLGQHFLTDLSIARRTVDAFATEKNFSKVLEVGPGMGVLTKLLTERKELEFFIIDIDKDSIDFLHHEFDLNESNIIEGDFLKIDLNTLFEGEKFGLIGNFPYNISTQILFKALEYKDLCVEIVGMFQKEVAERIASAEGSKVYGITSVFLQAYYDIEYLFTVDEDVFDPPPKVKSAVIRLKRNQVDQLNCDEKLFKSVVKSAFNQRRKTLRNSLKPFLSDEIKREKVFDQRPEQLSVDQFINLTNMIEKASKSQT